MPIDDNSNFRELIGFQKSRRKIKTGDVFVYQPKPSIYLWAKVIKAKIVSKELFFNGWHLIYVFNIQTSSFEKIPELNVEDLLFAPIIINARGWLDGYFHTVSNQTVTKEEMNLSYGFWDKRKIRYFDEHGELIDFIPKWKGTTSLYSYGYVGWETHRLLFGGVINDTQSMRSVFDDDLAFDMQCDLKKLLKKNSAEEAFTLLRKKWKNSFSDYDEGPLATVIFAKLQLEHGILWDNVKTHAIQVIESGTIIQLLLEHCSPEVISYNQDVLNKVKESLTSFKTSF